MKTVFIEALEKGAALSPEDDLGLGVPRLLKDVPGFLGAALMVRSDDPGKGLEPLVSCLEPGIDVELLRSFESSHPFPHDPFLRRLQVGDVRLVNGAQAQVFIVPHFVHESRLGELLLLSERKDEGATRDWATFAACLSDLLFARVAGAMKWREPRFDDPTPALEFLFRIHLMLSQERVIEPLPGKRDDELVEAWKSEDLAYLREFLHDLQSTFGLESAFVIQRLTDESVHVLVGSWVDKPESLPSELLEMIGDVFRHGGFGELVLSRIQVQTIGSLGGSPGGPPFIRLIPCVVGEETFGYLGIFTFRDTRMTHFAKLQTFLANHLGLWFANLFQVRKEILTNRLLKKINGFCNAANSATNLPEIISQLVLRLESEFGQKSGAVLLVSPATNRLEVACQFGSSPDGFDLGEAVKDPDTAKELLEGNHDLPGVGITLRTNLPLIPIPQMDTGGETALGSLVLFDVPENRVLEGENRNILSIFLNGITAALRVNLSVQEKLETIRSLEGLIKRLPDKDALIDEMIGIIQKLLKVTRISFLIVDEEGKNLIIQKSRGLPAGIPESTRIPIGAEISGFVAKTGKSLRIENIETARMFQKRSLEDYFNKSLLSVPLTSPSDDGEPRVMGVINVNNKVDGRAFDQSDQSLLETIAHLVAEALESSNLTKFKHESEMIQLQISMAKEVQTAFLPRTFKGLPDSILMAGKSIPARQIGGDFYDGLRLPDSRWLAAIGDVSGKGMPAALLMATTRMILRTVVQKTSDPVEILRQVNDLLTPELEIGYFVTLQVAVIDPVTGDAQMASAGHGPLSALIAGEPVRFSTEFGQPLGVADSRKGFGSIGFRMSPGDALLFFTDGLTEERSVSGEEFGLVRVDKIFRSSGGLSPAELLDGLFRAVGEWRGEEDSHDDLTILALKFKGKEAGTDA